ncbi:AAA family ATPase [Pannus brasiliensis CCIBt3594]|uniref:AAA family ATPase n=1 Tax=Pannus brasiliensis CCIBt3594 TaxID=1427578 RepID=A0AAW9QFR3_9CHRO
MKIKIKNLGPIKQAEFSLGDLTIICGGNNTGKTYATYALFGFLSTWRRFVSIKIDEDKIRELLAEGVIRLDIQEYVKNLDRIVAQGCQEYILQLPEKILASSAEYFKDTDFQVVLDTSEIQLPETFDRTLSTRDMEVFSIIKNQKSTDIIVTFLEEKEKTKIPDELLKTIISEALKDIIFTRFFPRPFIASVERTGAVIFRKELDFARNRLLKEMAKVEKEFDPMELFFKEYNDYALPIEKNVDFTRKLETIAKKNSIIHEKYPDILNDFTDIIGGEYTVTRDDEIHYIPKGKKIKLSMGESSSAVRSLLDIGFYLRHEARLGDLLIVDEPELNLHPENQRRMARLFARLVNIGIKVFITTHSDYIIKELNTLIMLNHDKPHLKRIAEREGYRAEELLSADKVKVYVAEEAPVKLEGKTRKTKVLTLVQAKIDPELGIEVSSFDKTIETMNRIQSEIVWGED